jgi:hypothetical protein
MSAINRNLRPSSRFQPSWCRPRRSKKLVISSNNVSRLLALPTKFQLTTLTRLNRSPISTVHSYSLCCECSPISSERSQLVARRRTCVETFGVRHCCTGWSAELPVSPSPVRSRRSRRSPDRSPACTSLRNSRQWSLDARN